MVTAGLIIRSPYHLNDATIPRMAIPRIIGFAIVSEDGMIADAQGVMPPELIIEADQRFFESGLDKATAVVHGRHSQEQHPSSASRFRLIVTRSVPALAVDPANELAMLWNPAGADFEEAWRALGITGGDLVVIGGTRIFEMFLPRYDSFNLSRVSHVRLPRGRPLFSQIPAQSPEMVLERYGLKPGPKRILDAAAGVAVVTWERRTQPDF